MSAKTAVIMCAHNSQAFIRQAIDSILAQSFADFELIIVENGSVDDSWEIIQSYHDRRIKAFRTPFKQLSFNLNFAMMQTDAVYIARMDTDDISRPDRLRKQVDFLDANPDITVLGGAFSKFDSQSGKSETIQMPRTNEEIRGKLAFRFCLCHPTVMFRKQAIVDAGGYQGGRYCQDVDLWLRLSRDEGIKFANMPDVLLDYRIHSDQVKGGRESFIINSIQLLREAMIQRSFRFFIGFIFALFKTLLRAGK